MIDIWDMRKLVKDIDKDSPIIGFRPEGFSHGMDVYLYELFDNFDKKFRFFKSKRLNASQLYRMAKGKGEEYIAEERGHRLKKEPIAVVTDVRGRRLLTWLGFVQYSLATYSEIVKFLLSTIFAGFLLLLFGIAAFIYGWVLIFFK